MPLLRRSFLVGLGFLIVGAAAASLGVIALAGGRAPTAAMVVLLAIFGLGVAGGVLALRNLAYGAKSIDRRGLTLELAFGDLRVTWDSVEWYRPVAQWWWLTRGKSYIWVLLKCRNTQAKRPKVSKILLSLPEVVQAALSAPRATALDTYIPEKRKS